jgi:hypothetical protein
MAPTEEAEDERLAQEQVEQEQLLTANGHE